MAKHPLLLLPLLLLFFITLQPISSLEFILNNFHPSNVSLYGNATIDSDILILTNTSVRNMGRAFFRHKIPTRPSNSAHLLPFYTSFIFSLAPPEPPLLPGHGFAFLLSPFSTIQGADSSQNLGLFSRTVNGNPENHVLGVEFDVFQNQEFNDIDDNHVGVDVNSLTSIASHTSGYWDDEFEKLQLSNGVNYQVWVDYSNYSLNVTMAPAGMTRPIMPLISTSVNLSDVLMNEMYVGFTASTGTLVQTQRILSWSFSNSNSRIGDELITSNLPSFVPRGNSAFPSKGLIISVSVATMFIVCCGFGICFVLHRKRKRLRTGNVEGTEDWEVEYWPHRIAYQDIHTATEGFSDESLIGVGGIGKVYKGVMLGGVEVAVKCILQGTVEGTREFLAEISSIGRLKHRNLVGFKGWCKRDKNSLILVYDYVPNGSLDKWIFDCDESMLLSWEDRVRVLKDVAEGVLYLHEGWESRVLHRDIKASNVMLDKDMNGRLGDFGLARVHGHGQTPTTTRVMGTAGYMAPEIVRSGRASAHTDVFGFGVLVLEVACGRRPIDDGKPYLIDWVWGLKEKGELVNAIDPRLKVKGGFDSEEMEIVLHLGLLCAYPDPRCRPTMRQVLKVLNDTSYEEETQGEGMEMSLLDKIKSTAMWSKCRQGTYPTISQIRQSIPSSLSWSDIISEGR